MNTPNIDQFKAWAKAHRQDALDVLAAQAFAECERERVDAYIQPIFNRYQFQYSGELAGDRKGDIIKDDNHLYLCDDEPRIEEYYRECDRAHYEHGFTGPNGYCPALTAEANLIKAQNAFLQLGCALFGLEDLPTFPEHRKRMLDLLLGACLTRDRKAA